MTLGLNKVYFDAEERDLMSRVLTDGLLFPKSALGRAGGTSGGHWWYVLRIALALSLRLPDPPDERYARRSKPKAEPHLDAVIGRNPMGDDLSSVFQALISAHQGEDLFSDEERFVEILQRHLRRGLEEINAGWRKGNDFFDFLRQELVTGVGAAEGQKTVESSRVLDVLHGQNVSCELEERTEGPRLTKLTLKLKSSGDLGRMRRAIDILPFELGQGHGATFEIAGGEKRIALFLPRPSSTWHTPKGSDGIKAIREFEGILPITPGVSVDGRPYVFDLVETPHLFVAGQTGSGKSVCIHTMIGCLRELDNPPLLALVDPKEMEFVRYSDLGKNDLYGGGIVTTPEDTRKLLDKLVQEMGSRQSILAKLKVTNLAEAQAKGSKLRYIVVVIDELADLVMGMDGAVDQLIRLAQKARAAGIHLILATQRPDADTFPGLLRANIPSRLALSVRSSAESRIILDETGAEKLLGKGDMLAKISGQSVRRLHGFIFD